MACAQEPVAVRAYTSGLLATPTNFLYASLTNTDGSVTVTRLAGGRLSLSGSSSTALTNAVFGPGTTGAIVNRTLWITNLWTTNGFVDASVTNGFVDASITNKFASTSYVNQATSSLASVTQPATANGTNWGLLATNLLQTLASNRVTVAAGANATVTTNHVGDTQVYTVAASAASAGFAALDIQTNNARVGLQTNLNFQVGAGLTLFATNDVASNKIDFLLNQVTNYNLKGYTNFQANGYSFGSNIFYAAPSGFPHYKIDFSGSNILTVVQNPSNYLVDLTTNANGLVRVIINTSDDGLGGHGVRGVQFPTNWHWLQTNYLVLDAANGTYDATISTNGSQVGVLTVLGLGSDPTNIIADFWIAGAPSPFLNTNSLGPVAFSNANAFIASGNGLGTNTALYGATNYPATTNGIALVVQSTTPNSNLVMKVTGTNGTSGLSVDAQGNQTNNGAISVSSTITASGKISSSGAALQGAGVILNQVSTDTQLDRIATSTARFNNGSGGLIAVQAGTMVLSNNSPTTASFAIWPTNSSNPAFMVGSNNNVGIGTNAPQSALHVVGNEIVSGNFTNSGTASIGGVDFTGSGYVGVLHLTSTFAGNGPDDFFMNVNGFRVASGRKFIFSSTSSASSASDGAWLSEQATGTIAVSTNLVLPFGSLGIGTTTPRPKLEVQGQTYSSGLALSNINGTASTSLTTGATLSSNVSVYTFSSGGGSDMTLSFATNSTYLDGTIWWVKLGVQGTNVLHITPTNFSGATSDKVYGGTDFVMVAGQTIGWQKNGTNLDIFSGLPSQPIGSSLFWNPPPPLCTNQGSFFAMCNGQTLTDPASPFNGLAITNDPLKIIRIK